MFISNVFNITIASIYQFVNHFRIIIVEVIKKKRNSISSSELYDDIILALGGTTNKACRFLDRSVQVTNAAKVTYAILLSEETTTNYIEIPAYYGKLIFTLQNVQCMGQPF